MLRNKFRKHLFLSILLFGLAEPAMNQADIAQKFSAEQAVAVPGFNLTETVSIDDIKSAADLLAITSQKATGLNAVEDLHNNNKLRAKALRMLMIDISGVAKNQPVDKSRIGLLENLLSNVDVKRLFDNILFEEQLNLKVLQILSNHVSSNFLKENRDLLAGAIRYIDQYKSGSVASKELNDDPLANYVYYEFDYSEQDHKKLVKALLNIEKKHPTTFLGIDTIKKYSDNRAFIFKLTQAYMARIYTSMSFIMDLGKIKMDQGQSKSLYNILKKLNKIVSKFDVKKSDVKYDSDIALLAPLVSSINKARNAEFLFEHKLIDSSFKSQALIDIKTKILELLSKSSFNEALSGEIFADILKYNKGLNLHDSRLVILKVLKAILNKDTSALEYKDLMGEVCGVIKSSELKSKNIHKYGDREILTLLQEFANGKKDASALMEKLKTKKYKKLKGLRGLLSKYKKATDKKDSLNKICLYASVLSYRLKLSGSGSDVSEADSSVKKFENINEQEYAIAMDLLQFITAYQHAHSKN